MFRSWLLCPAHSNASRITFYPKWPYLLRPRYPEKTRSAEATRSALGCSRSSSIRKKESCFAGNGKTAAQCKFFPPTSGERGSRSGPAGGPSCTRLGYGRWSCSGGDGRCVHRSAEVLRGADGRGWIYIVLFPRYKYPSSPSTPSVDGV